MLQLGPHKVSFENKSLNNVSENGNPICKKPRTCEVTCYPSPNMHVPTNYNPRSGNFNTHLCTLFRSGHCSYGNKCFFAHGTGEMRQCLPNMQLQRPVVTGDGLGRVWNGVKRIGNQSNVCNMFYFKKECRYGDKCRFLHESSDKKKIDFGDCRESSSIIIGTRGISGGCGSGFAGLKPVSKKYKLCNKWEMTGSCPYGKKCCFAHGIAELEKPAGHIELVSGFLSSKTSKTLLPTGKDVIRTSYAQQVQNTECIFKRKEVEKISGIYADWIEDMPLLHHSPEKCG